MCTAENKQETIKQSDILVSWLLGKHTFSLRIVFNGCLGSECKEDHDIWI